MCRTRLMQFAISFKKESTTQITTQRPYDVDRPSGVSSKRRRTCPSHGRPPAHTDHVLKTSRLDVDDRRPLDVFCPTRYNRISTVNGRPLNVGSIKFSGGPISHSHPAISSFHCSKFYGQCQDWMVLGHDCIDPPRPAC
jgi:hypothetical protein